MNYKESGVDIDAGNQFVKSISQKVQSTQGKSVLGGFGGFSGMMRLPEGYEKPVLVSGIDGVGSKCYVAGLINDENSYYAVGRDLVAMSVNDVITSGAKPLYFLDYIATHKIEEEKLKQVVFGIADGCIEAQCSLLGGETAEIPKIYQSMKYDLAGTCTGIVEETEIIDGSLIKPGDKVIGIASSGLHSNGFSLICNLLFHQKVFLQYRDKGDEDLGIGEELVKPTRIYSRLIQHLLDEVPIVGMAHITGGGIPENLPRCLPDRIKVMVDYNAWPLPDIFRTIMCAGEIPEEEMKRVFNMGIGYCLVVPPEVADDTRAIIRDFHGWDSWEIGEAYIG